jgi:hypothetical protein
MKAIEPDWKMDKLQSMKPVLGGKNYSQSVVQHEIGVNVSDQNHSVGNFLLQQNDSLFVEPQRIET